MPSLLTEEVEGAGEGRIQKNSTDRGSKWRSPSLCYQSGAQWVLRPELTHPRQGPSWVGSGCGSLGQEHKHSRGFRG